MMGENIFFIFILTLVFGFGFLFFSAAVKNQKGLKKAWVSLPAISLIFFLFLSSVIFLGLESYYRFFYDATDSFGLSKVTQRWFSRYYHRNGFGARDNIDYYVHGVPGRPRITFLGDSFTAGHGIKNVDDRFANLIRQKKSEWEIHVFAQNGFDTGAEINFLQKAFRLHYPPGLVVLVYCLNDISDITPAWQTILRRIYEKNGKEPWLVRHSFFFNLWYYRLRGRKDPDISNYYGFVKESYRGLVWEIQKKRLLIMRQLIEKNGGRMAVVTFPFLHRLGPSYDYTEIHNQLDAFWKEAGVPHLDLKGLYEGFNPRDLTVNRFDAHPNEKAHLKASESIVEFLSPILKSDSTDSIDE